MYGKRKNLFIKNSYQFVMTVLTVLSGFSLMKVWGIYLPPNFQISWFIIRGYIPLNHPRGGFHRIFRIGVEFLVDQIVCRQIFNNKEEHNALCFLFHICSLIFIENFY